MSGHQASPSVVESAELPVGISVWMVCSIGMLLFNKMAITVFPVECSLVALQMSTTVIVMLVFCWSSLHVGSKRDVLRWMLVVPFFTGMLLTSILALKAAPMSLVVTFRAISPLVSLGVERFYPNPLRVTKEMVLSLAMMIVGVGFYTAGLDKTHIEGIGWVLLNNFFAIGDRLLQRYMLARDQNPVDISKTGVTLLNNLLGMMPLLLIAFVRNEFAEVPAAVAHLDTKGAAIVAASCIVGVGISYAGIWVQSLISATSFLVLVNANKFVIIFLEAFIMHTKHIETVQIVGASTAILGGVAYGLARQAAEASEAEKLPLVGKD